MSYDVFYSDHYLLPLPLGHRFPGEKYLMLRELLLAEGVLRPQQLRPSPLVDYELLKLAHGEDYIRSVREGTVDLQEWKRVGFPWSEELVSRVRGTVGGAVEATQSALRDGVAGALAGGTHHAHADRGEGYCVFNDIAVASRFLVNENRLERIAVLDLDVHQGNGNSSILGRDKEIFIASIHGEKNYPFHKVASSIDIGLPDGTGDDEYMTALEVALEAVEKFRPQYLFYQMGVDPLKEDKLGKLDLTFDGLMRRDRRVFEYAKSNSIPISLALGGGYSNPIEHSVRAYANTYRTLNEVYGFHSFRA